MLGVAGYIPGGWLIDPIGGNLGANNSIQTADLVGKFRRLNGRPKSSCAQGDQTCE